jgi:lipopolysaccharide export system protein LptA
MPLLLLRCPARLAASFAACLAAWLLLAMLPGVAGAERADRSQPLTIEADKPGIIDLQKQVVVFSGNVAIAQGSIRILADRVEVREGPDGFRAAVATGAPGQPASFRQKRDGVDEYLEGRADRIDYDGRGDKVTFTGNASVRRLRGNAVADEITGNLITYDNLAELFSVAGGPAAPSGSGRVRAVLTPREGSPAARGDTPPGPPAGAERK